MIVEWFCAAVAALLGWIPGIFPNVPVPGWLADSDSTLNNFLTQFGSLGAWAPLGLGITVVTAYLACLLAGFVIKVIRIVASFLLAGGGSAG